MQRVASPCSCECHIHAARVAQEADAALLVGPHTRHHDVVLLTALHVVGVHSRPSRQYLVSCCRRRTVCSKSAILAAL